MVGGGARGRGEEGSEVGRTELRGEEVKERAESEEMVERELNVEQNETRLTFVAIQNGRHLVRRRLGLESSQRKCCRIHGSDGSDPFRLQDRVRRW